MNRVYQRTFFAACLFQSLYFAAWTAPAQSADESTTVVPDHFQAVHQLLADHVEQQKIAGAVGLVIDDGKVVYSDAVGYRDVASQTQMTHDTLFRIASMTKPITSVSVMMLVEEGKLSLNDPVFKYIPAFADAQVLVVDENGNESTVPAERDITIHDLLTHRSGLTYGFMGGLHQALYQQAGVTNGLIESSVSLAEHTNRLAKQPLTNHPGTAWQYGLSCDVLGRVIEVVSGQALDKFFQERIFEPLGMHDTGFSVSAEQLPRLATVYRPGADERIEPVGDGPQDFGGLHYSATFPHPGAQKYRSGGAGLVSSASDYARFLRMLAGRGEVDGVRLLQPETVAEMTRNQIGDQTIFFTVHGDKFGLGFGVHSKESELAANGEQDGVSIGSYSWGGVFHTYFWIDPKRDVIGIVMTQLYPFTHLTFWADYTKSVYGALTASAETSRATGPQPGEVYREYATHNGGNLDWRVTDPRARSEGAWKFLPNPLLTIQIDDLENAVRAEAVIDRWGGHVGTADKRIRFNHNPWLRLPELATTSSDRPEYYYSQDNPVIDVPLEHLHEGLNTFDGTCGVPDGVGWGQWGLYSLILRVYYDPATTPHATGKIVSPVAGAILGENPTVEIESSESATRVDVLGWYNGIDENGDGRFLDWHGSRHQVVRGEPADLLGHVGTSNDSPHQIVWDTHWVPDQQPGAIKLIARIQNGDGLWSVTEPVENLSLKRDGNSVALYKAQGVPERFGVRVGRQKSCTYSIPEDARLDNATVAVLALRTWHGWDGHHKPLQFNGRQFPIDGENHHYDFDLLPLATKTIKPGENVFKIESDTEHHMLEVLWPGPSLLVRYDNAESRKR